MHLITVTFLITVPTLYVNPCIKDAFSRLMCSLQTCNKEPPHREPLENLPHQDNKETHLLDLNETLYLIYNMISFN